MLAVHAMDDPMNTKKTERRTKVSYITERIGTPAVLEQMAEKCMELGHACLKEAWRLRGENPTHCTEEDCRNAIKRSEWVRRIQKSKKDRK